MSTQVLTNDSYSSLLWNDGELITPADLNDAHSMTKRVLQRVLDSGPASGVAAGGLATVGTALAFDTSAMDVVLQPGLVIWRPSSAPVSPAPPLLLHDLASTQTFTADTADATYDRWDVISAKVEDGFTGDSTTRVFKDTSTGLIVSQTADKRTQTRLTLTYTPGTAASSPAEPSAPTGEVVIARIVVAAGASSVTVIDRRTPLGYASYDATLVGATGWARGTYGITASGTNVIALRIDPPFDPASPLRLMAIEVDYLLSSGAAVQIVSAQEGTSTTIADITSQFSLDGLAGTAVADIYSLFGAAAQGGAVWSGGRTNPYPTGDPGTRTMLLVGAGAASDAVYRVTSFWHGGNA